MADRIIAFFQSGFENPEWATFFLAMLPITELRLALPWALTMTDMTWYSAYFISILGNFLITIPIVFFLKPVSDWFRRWPAGERFFTWLFARTRRKGQMIERLEFWGLVVFVGIPLPVTGAWTGAAAAFVFGLTYKKTFSALLLGLFMSATIVLTITLFGETIFEYLRAN